MVTTTPSGVKTNQTSGLRLWERLLRRTVRVFWLLFFLATIGLIGLLAAYTLWIPLALASIFWRPARALADQVLSQAVALNLRIQPWLKTDIRVEMPRTPSGEKGVLVVSNHRSHLDAFILLARIPGLRILAKRSLFWVPLLNIMMLLTRQIPVSRGDIGGLMRALESVRGHLRAGGRVHVFPELTRCAPGYSGTLSFSVAPFQAAFQEGAQILPVVFYGTDKAWPKGEFGVGPGSLARARSLAVIDAANFKSSTELRDYVRAQINEALT